MAARWSRCGTQHQPPQPIPPAPWPAIIGFSGGDSAAVSGYNLVRGRLRFYTLPPLLNSSGNFTTTPGICLGEMETNGWNFRGHLIQEQQVSSSSTAFVVDFSNARLQTFDCGGPTISFTTANLPGGATNFVQVDLLIRSGPFTVTPTFPAWKWGNEAGSAVAPASLPAQKALLIKLSALGTTDASVLASYSIHSWPFAYDSDASAFFTRASITDDTQKWAVNQLVLDAKAHGNWWAKCDAIYPFVGGTATAHSKNLKANTFNITWNGYLNTAPAHTSSGATSDGSSGSYGSTGFTPSTAGGVYVQDSAHIFVYCGTTTPADCRVMGVYGANAISVGLQVSSSYWYGVIDTGQGYDTLVSPSGDWRGPVFMTRTGASAETISANAGSAPAAVASTGLPNSPIYIFARDDSGTGEANRFTGNLRGASIGSGLSTTDIASMKTDWDNFENTLSRKVP